MELIFHVCPYSDEYCILYHIVSLNILNIYTIPTDREVLNTLNTGSLLPVTLFDVLHNNA